VAKAAGAPAPTPKAQPQPAAEPAKAAAALSPKLTKEEVDALKAYTGGPLYAPKTNPDDNLLLINQGLREGATLTSSQKNIVNTMDRALSKLPSNSKGEEFYRGIEIDPNTASGKALLAKLKSGAVFEDKGFGSYTKDKDTADEFANQMGGRAIIFVTRDKNLRDVGKFAPQDFDYQQEFILPRNTSLQIVSVQDKNGIKYVKLEPIPQKPAAVASSAPKTQFAKTTAKAAAPAPAPKPAAPAAKPAAAPAKAPAPKAKPEPKEPTAAENWYAARKATYDSMKGLTKQEVLQRLNGLKKVHGLTMKDSITSMKNAVVEAKHGNKTPKEKPALVPTPKLKTQPAPKPQTPDAQKPLPNAPPHVSKAYGFDKNFNSQSARKEGDASFDGWGGSYGNTTKKLGQGAFGTVVLNPDGTVIKRGIISDTEAALIKKAGEAGVSPKLIAAQIGPRNNTPTSAPVKLHDGRIAMSKADGEKVEVVAGKTFNGVTAADAFWRARGDLHKIGIAHNDMHTDNILVDKGGKGTVIDLGFAQDSRKAALSEALGAFKPPSAGTAIPGVGKQKGDWQVRQWNGNGSFRLKDVEMQGVNSKAAGKLLQEAPYLHRLYTQNLPKVFAEMKKMGYNDDEIKTIAITGIKNQLDAYEKGPWAKMTDADAQKLTNILYDGN
jgi:hypothetical protein